MLESVSLATILILFGCIMVSMTLHEAMHAFTGLWLGDDTAHREGRITLNPLKHIDMVTTVLLPILLVAAGLPPFFVAKPVPFNPYRVKYEEFGAALVGIAGPATNLLLALAMGGLVNVFGFPSSSLLGEIVVVFVFVNIAFFVFNMIPFPPLDGSRVLYAFAPEPVQRVMQRIESFGFGAILLFMFLFFPVLAPLVRNITNDLLNFLLGGVYL
jgi:Zn-dependent protease